MQPAATAAGRGLLGCQCTAAGAGAHSAPHGPERLLVYLLLPPGRRGRGRRKPGRKEGRREGGGLFDCQPPGCTPKLPAPQGTACTQPKSETQEQGEASRLCSSPTPTPPQRHRLKCSAIAPNWWAPPGAAGSRRGGYSTPPTQCVPPRDPCCPQAPRSGRFLFTQNIYSRHFPGAWVTMGWLCFLESSGERHSGQEGNVRKKRQKNAQTSSTRRGPAHPHPTCCKLKLPGHSAAPTH